MIKNNKWKLIASSLIILLPMISGLVFWNRFPEIMPTHWGVNGQVDGMGGRGLFVFGLPLIMLAMHLIGIFITDRDPGNKHQSNKAISIMYWIIPAITLMITGVMYLVSTGREINAASWLAVVLGINFLVLGNYMPKFRRNFTMGIKIKWTLESEANWNATHRFAGKLWVVIGLVLLACIPLAEKAFIGICLAIIVVTVALPFIYSWRFHKKQVAEGYTPDKPVNELKKWQKVLVSIIVTGILVFVIIIMFTGNINVHFNETSFVIEATFYADLTVEYDAIDNIEYRESFDKGTRTNGFDSPRLSMGTFKNDEFGNYTIYAYNSSTPCIVITSGEKKLAIRAENETATKELYENLITR